ncbi:MAG: pentapeptide repeat-containing protein [Cyanobacteria bacterium P01_A01_bin.45]
MNIFSPENKINYAIQTLITTGIIFTILIVNLIKIRGENISLNIKDSKTDKNIISAINLNQNEESTLEIELSCCNLQSSKQLIDNRFTSAIQQLGNEKVETRSGAIYALEKIAKDSPEYHWIIMETLAAFVRENAPIIEIEAEFEYSSSISTDVQTALTIIGRRNSQEDPENKRLDLHSTDLRGVELVGANLRLVDFTEANLAGVMLYQADLSESYLTGANLTEAVLYEANLQNADLYEANLQQAVMRKADCSQANLYQANLQQTILYEANLQKATLYGSNLQGAMLYETNLSQANLEDTDMSQANLIGANLLQSQLIGSNLEKAVFSIANLSEANLYEARLCGANFSEANLSEANLTGADLKEAKLFDTNLSGTDLSRAVNIESGQIGFAKGDDTTNLPDYLEKPSCWGISSDENS